MTEHTARLLARAARFGGTPVSVFTLAEEATLFEAALSIAFFFFFQAEDGIRDLIVTGVQTCALPIFFCRMPLEKWAGRSSTRSSRPRRVTRSAALTGSRTRLAVPPATAAAVAGNTDRKSGGEGKRGDLGGGRIIKKKKKKR